MVVVRDYYTGERYFAPGRTVARYGRRDAIPSRGRSGWLQVINPIGLGKRIWDTYKYYTDYYTNDLYQTMYGPNYDPENPSVPKKQTKISGKKRKKRNKKPRTDVAPVQQTDPVVTDVPAVTDAPAKPPVIPIMTGKGLVSHSAQHCCVDLGSFDIPAKPFRHLKKEDIGHKNMFLEYHQELKATNANSTHFNTIGEPKFSSFGGSSAQPIPIYITTDGDNAINGIGFNSVNKLIKSWNQLGSLTFPGYDYSTGLGVTDGNDAWRAVVLDDQYVEIKIKNYGGTSQLDTPLFITIYGYQFKEDVYSGANSATTSDNYHLSYLINNGWGSFFDGASSTTNLVATPHQPYGVNVGNNSFLEEYCHCIGTLKNCLAMGQEGTARFLLKEPQYFNFKDFAMARPAGATSYHHILHRKGEIFFYIKAHGGTQQTTTATAATSVRIENVNFSVFMTSRWNMRQVFRTLNAPKFTLNVTRDTATTDADVDITEYFV